MCWRYVSLICQKAGKNYDQNREKLNKVVKHSMAALRLEAMLAQIFFSFQMIFGISNLVEIGYKIFSDHGVGSYDIYTPHYAQAVISPAV